MAELLVILKDPFRANEGNPDSRSLKGAGNTGNIEEALILGLLTTGS